MRMFCCRSGPAMRALCCRSDLTKRMLSCRGPLLLGTKLPLLSALPVWVYGTARLRAPGQRGLILC
eukprot:358045-Chlamydomonas_euryale.AAC.6